MAFLQEYTMLDEIGKGGFATVYKVRHNELGYIRAIRVLNETIVDANSKTYQKFMRECKVLLRLGNGSHPNIVHIYQPRLLENKALVEMDYVDGQDISHFLRQEHRFIPIEEVLRMAEQISSALAYCHEDIYEYCMDRDLDQLQDDPNDGSKVLMDEATRQRLISKYKVIHNDIHSGNIMRRKNGNYVLLDFGLAINGDEVVHSSRHTNGAPEFKAPEKWDDESVLSEQSDIYSFGVVLYEMLAGRVPFPMDTHIPNYKAESFVAEAHQHAIPPSIEALRKEFFEQKFEGQVYEKDYPQWLEDTIMKCLAKNPTKRFRNGKELYNFITGHSHENAMISDVLESKIEMDEKDLYDVVSAKIKKKYEKKISELESTIVELKKENDYLREQLQKNQQDLEPLPKTLPYPIQQYHDLYFNINKANFKMVYIEGGTFKMGSTNGQRDEQPPHDVTVNSFYMGEFEVTQELWYTVMDTSLEEQRDKVDINLPTNGTGPHYPMYYVSYEDAKEFCRQINKLLREELPDGYRFDLPSEAEWEYAAQGGNKSKQCIFSGSNKLSGVGWFYDNSDFSTHIVGSKSANELGLYDMSGNVWEWCEDWYSKSFYSSNRNWINPVNTTNSSSRVLRGGSWYNEASDCHVSYRANSDPQLRYDVCGFRLALVRR